MKRIRLMSGNSYIAGDAAEKEGGSTSGWLFLGDGCRRKSKLRTRSYQESQRGGKSRSVFECETAEAAEPIAFHDKTMQLAMAVFGPC